MRRALAAMTVAVVCGAVAACGGDRSARDDVDAYVARANAIQKEWRDEFRRANQAYARFANQQTSAEEAVAALDRAGVDMRAARRDIAVLRPPAAARALHSHLQRVFDLNIQFADETRRLAAYQRGAGQALAPLGRLDRQLRRELRSAEGPEAQARALDGFRAGLDRALRRLRSLEVPYVLKPGHGDQVRRLDGARELAVRLEEALREQDAPRVARLLKAFRRSGSTRTIRRRLARQALSQYTRRHRQLNEAYAALARENTRLDRTLD